MEGIGNWWDSLNSNEKQQVTLVALIAIWMSQNYLYSVIVVFAIVMYLSSRKPSEASFMAFFESWVKIQYYPKIADRIESLLRERAARKQQSGSFLSSLGDRAGAFLLNQTKGIQSNLYFESVLRVSSPLEFKDLGILIRVGVNMGSREEPNIIYFWGIHEHWILAPYITLNTDNVTIPETFE